MEKRHDRILGMELPDGVFALRADRNAPFKYVQKVLESCGRSDTLLWKTAFEVSLPEDRGPGLLRCYLPRDVGVNTTDAEPKEKVEIRILVLDPGQRRRADDPEQAWDGTGRFVYAGRELEYRMGPWKGRDLKGVARRLTTLYRHDAHGGGIRDVTIDARRGVLHGEVVAVIDAVLQAGYSEVTFVGSYEDDD